MTTTPGFAIVAANLAALAALALPVGPAWAQVPAGYPAGYGETIAAAKKEGKVVVYSTTDTAAAGPLIKDFQALYPGISVEYNDMNSTEVYNRYISERAANAGLADVPHVYLYSSSALKNLGSDVEEAARMSGDSPFQVARDVSLPMVTPSLLFSGVLVFFLGFEIFGLPLVLGDPEGHLVLATYLYKLTNKLGTPSYHLMAAVAVCIVAVTFPLVLLQRVLLKSAGKYVTVKGKAGRQRPFWRCGSCSASWCRYQASPCAPSSRIGAKA